MEAAWNPWRTLAELAHVMLEVRPIDGDTDALLLPGPTIVLHSRLDRRERRAALAHELVHLERGGGVGDPAASPAWDALTHREEHIVDREVARRLVPPGALARFARARADVHERAEVTDVEDEFDVPTWVAELALTSLDASTPR